MTLKKARARKALELRKTASPKRFPYGIYTRYGFAVVRVCRPCSCPQAGAGQRCLALASNSIFRVIASVPAGSRTGPRLHSFGSIDLGILTSVQTSDSAGPALPPRRAHPHPHIRIVVALRLELCSTCCIGAGSLYNIVISFKGIPIKV